MLEEHLNSHAFQTSVSKAQLKKCRKSLHLSVMDNIKPSRKEILSIHGKTAFLVPTKDMDDIIEAIVKVTKNADSLA